MIAFLRMECPKCGGGCLLSEEELIKILEEKAASALRAIVKGTYICRACSEKFSRLFVDDLASRRRPPESRPAYYRSEPAAQPQPDPADSLKFF